MKGLILRRRKLGLGSCRGIRDASQTGLDFVRNDQMKAKTFEGIDFVFRWGCSSNLPDNVSVVNNAAAIHKIANKGAFRNDLLMCPETTNLVPPTVFTMMDADAQLNAGHTLFIRPKHHAQGKQVYLAKTQDELIEAVAKCGVGWYASHYIKKVAEYRVFVCQGCVVWIAKKTPGNPDDPAWNVAQGGRFDNVRWDEWPLDVADAAIKAFNVSGLHFGGVDVMVSDEGLPYVIEINSAPSQTSPYRQQCTAKAFDHIVANGKEYIGIDENYNGWRRFIHPAVWTKKQKENV